MYYIYITLTLVLTFYLFLIRKIFDGYAFFFVSSLVYFLTTFFGTVVIPTDSTGSKSAVAIPEDQYIVYIIFLATFSLSLLINDTLFKKKLLRRFKKREYNFSVSQKKRLFDTGLGFLLLSGIIFLVLLHLNPELTSFQDRTQFVDSKPFYYNFYTLSAIGSFICLFASRNYLVAALPLCLIAFDFYLGSREFIAGTVFGLALFLLSRIHSPSFTKMIGYGLISVISILFMLGFKYAYPLLKQGETGAFMGTLMSPDFMKTAFLYSEPSIIQGNLYAILHNDFSLPITHLAPIFLFLTPIHQSWTPFNITPISRIMEARFYGGLDYGIAGNFLGEFIAIFGPYFFIPLFIYISAAIFIVNFLISSSRPILFVFGIIFSFYSLFYIHRIEFYEIFGSARVIVLICAISWAIGKLIGLVTSLFTKGYSSHPIRFLDKNREHKQASVNAT